MIDRTETTTREAGTAVRGIVTESATAATARETRRMTREIKRAEITTAIGSETAAGEIGIDLVTAAIKGTKVAVDTECVINL